MHLFRFIESQRIRFNTWFDALPEPQRVLFAVFVLGPIIYGPMFIASGTIKLACMFFGVLFTVWVRQEQAFPARRRR